MDKFSEISYWITLVVSIISCILSIITWLATIKYAKTQQPPLNFKGQELTHKPLLYYFIRLFDILSAIFALFMFFPLLIIIGSINRICSGNSIFVRQTILGKNSQPINLYKFRTKNDVGSEPKHYAFGSFLRKTALNNLPLYFNLLKGDITLFGLARIDYDKIDEIESIVTDIKLPYNYYQPGIVSEFALTWNTVKKFDKLFDYYEFLHATNMYFLSELSIKHMLQMLLRTIYLTFKPFESTN